MIEFAKMTGELDGNLLQVRMKTGECLYAPIAVPYIGATLPTKDWVSDNKDSFLAIVGYEGETFYDPFILGFFPVKGADSREYSVNDRMYKCLVKLVEQLLKAKVNTQIGPQPFMADTIKVINEVKSELDNIGKLMLDFKK